MIKLENVSKYYKNDSGVSVGLKDISLSFSIGEFIGVCGQSGSGKTTLLNVISGLDTYEDGEMYLFSSPTSHYDQKDYEKYRGSYVGFVFQNYNIIDSHTVFQNVLLALEIENYNIKERKKKALELLDKVGLKKLKNMKAKKLSGGEKQRLVIARALAKDSPIIACDEPTGNLDRKNAKMVIDLLKQISKDKLVIIVTHDFEQIKEYATRKIELKDGMIVSDETLQNTDKKEIIKPDLSTISHFQSFKWALRYIVSKPFIMLFQVFLVLFFTISLIFLISFPASVDMNSYAHNRGAYNFPETEIKLRKVDGSYFTDSDVNKLKQYGNVYNNFMLFNFNRASSLLNKDSLRFYDFTKKNAQLMVEDISDASALTKSSLLNGRLPKNSNEVVVYKNSNLKLGQTISLSSSPVRNSSLHDFKVVGIADILSSTIFLLPSYIENISYFKNYEFKLRGAFNTYQFVDIRKDNSLTNNNIIYESKADEHNLENSLSDINITLDGTEYKLGKHNIKFRQNLNSPDTIIYLSSEKYDELVNRFTKSEIKIFTSSLVSANEIADKIDNTIYYIYTNPKPKSPEFVQQVLSGLVFTLIIFASIIFIVLYLVLRFVVKNILTTFKRDFNIFRTMGANEKSVSRLVIYYQLLIGFISMILTIIFTIIGYMFIGQLSYINTAFGYISVVVVFIILMILEVFLGLAYNKTVFKISIVKSLSLED